MSTPLVNELRTCNKRDRKSVALRLAVTGSEDVVLELIRMVEGRRRRFLRFYGFQDQLTAIEALSLTKSKLALACLRKLIQTKATSLGMYSIVQGIDVASEYFEETVEYPNARKALRKALRFTDHYASSGSWQVFTPEESKEIEARFNTKEEKERLRIPSYPSEAFKIVAAAIGKLEADLKINA